MSIIVLYYKGVEDGSPGRFGSRWSCSSGIEVLGGSGATRPSYSNGLSGTTPTPDFGILLWNYAEVKTHTTIPGLLY